MFAPDFVPDAEDVSPEEAAFDVAGEGFDLFQAASLLPRVAGREPDHQAAEAELDRLAQRVQARVADDPSWPGPLAGLVEALFYEAGWQGDAESYDDPHNSFLDAVLERRRGLPITLSVLTCEVARRAGLDAYGIGFPGHFLVGVQHQAQHGPGELVVIDPFHRGRVLTPDALEKQLSALMKRPVELVPEHLMPAGPRNILVRMLVNLRGSYARRRDPVAMYRVLSRLLLLMPGNAEALAERAVVRRDLLDLDGARRDAEAALAAAADSREPAAQRAQRVLRTVEADLRWVH